METKDCRSVEKAVSLTRKIMIKDMPGVFSGVVEVDETYLGGQKKNKTKQPVFGILTRQGRVFTKLVDAT